MKKSAFSPKFSRTTKGTKVTTELRPEVKCGNGFNKLIINGKATGILKLDKGEYVEILVNDNAEDLNDMFVIAKSTGDLGGMKVASKGVGTPANLNYSSIYSRLLQGKVGATAVSKKALADMGLMREEETQMNKDKTKMCKAHKATEYVSYEVVDEPMEIEVEIDDAGTIHTYTAYPLQNMKRKPRVEGEEEEGEVTDATNDVEELVEE